MSLRAARSTAIRDVKQALYACVYLEEAAKAYVAARSMSDDLAMLTSEQVSHVAELFKSYGQKEDK